VWLDKKHSAVCWVCSSRIGVSRNWGFVSWRLWSENYVWLDSGESKSDIFSWHFTLLPETMGYNHNLSYHTRFRDKSNAALLIEKQKRVTCGLPSKLSLGTGESFSKLLLGPKHVLVTWYLPTYLAPLFCHMQIRSIRSRSRTIVKSNLPKRCNGNINTHAIQLALQRLHIPGLRSSPLPCCAANDKWSVQGNISHELQRRGLIV